MTKDIYIIKNKINNKVYIGQAKDSKVRFQHHCKPSAAYNDNELVAKAIQKYGKDKFWFEILESQIEDYNEKERYYIMLYQSQAPHGYNLLEGGENPPIMPGTLHPEAKLNNEQVDALTKDLKDTTISFVELAKKYGFASNTSIMEFNKGITYVRNIIYPIRKEVYNGKLSPNDVDDIIKILKTTYRSYENIGTQFNVEYRAIMRINKGILHKKENEIYPIREGRLTSVAPKYTYEQVSEIIDLLLHTTLSLREIAQRVGGEYRNVLNIKNGSTELYRRRGLTYPLRPNN